MTLSALFMNKTKTCSLGIAVILFGISVTSAYCCEQHFPDGTIGNCPDQTCEDFIDPGDGTTCVECPVAFYNPDKYEITYSRKLGEAWIVTGEKGKKPVRIMSNKYVAFSKTMQEKYGKVKRDKATNEKIKLEFVAFFKTDDNKVSPERLKQSSKSLNLKIRNIE